MANDKKFVVKNGLTTQNIAFVDDITDANNTINVTMISGDTLSFSGDTGQLFSITDSQTGTIFAVNDISGVPSIEVDDDGTIRFAETFGNILIGTATDTGEKLQINGKTKITSVDNGTGDFLTRDANGVITRRTAAQVLADIGAEGGFTKGNLVAGTNVTLSGTLTNRLVGTGDVTVNAAATNLGITAGTTAGPIVTSSTGTNATLPTATATNSGVVTTAAQTWAGVKTFNSTIAGSISGNAGTATTLQTARTIGGVSFNGSANIDLPGVNTTGNQNTTGSAASLTTARTLTIGITGKTFNGTANVAWSLAEIGVNNSTLTLATSGIATGSQTWTSNQGSNATFTVNVPATNLSATAGTTAGPVINSSTGTNVTIPSASGTASGIVTTGAQTFTGDKTFSGNVTGTNLTLSGNLTVNGTTTTLNTTNTVIKDNLIELNNGVASNANDSGIVIERGTTGDNAFIGWDESADKFIVGTTTATGTGTGNLIITPGTLVASTFEGNLTGAVTGNASTATTLQTARTINGVSFNGSANITITANTPNTLTRGTYLTGNNFNGSAATTWAVDATTTNTASKVVARDASGNFAAGTITAALSGNATTATTLQTARTINGTSFNGSANITTANWGNARTLTIGNTGKSVNGSGNVAWNLAEIGALPLTGGTITGNLTVTGNTNIDSIANFISPDNNSTITAEMLNGGTLSFEGTSGQLFSITDTLTGIIFSVNDISGIPSIEVDDDGTIRFAETFGNILIGTNVDNTTDKVQVDGDILATNFKGDLLGNANTASSLETARTISLGGDVSGSAVFDGSANANITVTIADDSHNHTIANVDGLQTALDGKVDDSQVLTNVPAGAVFTDTTYSVGNGGLTEINFTTARSSKLDGIETGATGDQTATEIRTALLTVDGTGSGLDSDLLDGQHGSYYLDYNNFTNTPTDTDTTYDLSIPATGVIRLSDSANSNDDITVVGSGATSVSSNTTHIIISSTDNNTTYSAGNGINLSGTTFSVAAGSGLTQDATGLSHSDTSTQASLTALTGANVVSDIDLDGFGHVTSLATRAMTLADLGYTGSTNADNYGDWGLYTDGTFRNNVTSGENVNFLGGNSITVSYSATNNITINHADTSTQASVNNSGTTVIQDVTLDGFGHVTGLASTTIPTYANSDVDSHLNTGTATTDQVLSWNGSDYDWVDGSQPPAYTKSTFTATASQTTFSVTYTVGYTDVFLNGVKLSSLDYTATNGTSVVLATGATAGDSVEILAWNTSVGAYTDNNVDTHLNTGTATTNQILSWTGSDYDWIDQSSSSSYANADVDSHLNTGTATTNQILSWTGSDYDWINQPSSYSDTDVDTHLNTGTATTNQILSWTGSDYDWINQTTGTVTTSGSPVSGDFARFVNGTSIEGRSASETRSDLGLVIGTNVHPYDSNLTGTTSNVQTQLDSKASTGKAIAMAIVFG